MPEMLRNMDAALLLAVQDMRLEALNPLVQFYTALGDAGMLWIAGSLMLLIPKSTRKAGFLALGSLALGFLCTNVILKHAVGRPRPWLALPELVPLIREGDPNSFPSGHSTAAFAAGTAWALSLDHLWVKCAAMGAAACMALSRLYVGVHYPSDVICGSLIGAGCAWAVWKLSERRTLGRHS